MIFSNLDSMRSILQQARDNAKHLSNLNVNAARTFENNSRQIASAVSEASSSNSQDNNSRSSSSNNQTTYYSTTTTATAKSNRK